MRPVLCVIVLLLTVPALANAPQRIVSLAPAVTEMLFAVGAGGHVVGDTTYCNYPARAKSLPHIGDVRTNYEAVLALRPDLVVASDANGPAAARLRSLGVNVLTVAPTSFDSTVQSVRQIGAATGHVSQAETVAKTMEHKARLAARFALADGKRPRVLCVVGTGPLWTAGAGTFVDDVLRRAGAVNAAAGVNGYGPLSPEAVLSRPPDFVLATGSDAESLRRVPAFAGLSALRPGRVVAYDADTLLRPGPRLADALVAIARALHGGKLSEGPPGPPSLAFRGPPNPPSLGGRFSTACAMLRTISIGNCGTRPTFYCFLPPNLGGRGGLFSL